MKKCYYLLPFLLVSFSFIGIDLFAQTPAFPTAQGYGRFATGGRGGDVVEVTTLEDYNPQTDVPIKGSFRWAFTQAKDSTKNQWGVWKYTWRPITIVFRVGGVIDLKADFALNRDSVTIAGQTALGDGICFKNYTIKLGGHENFIVRYVRSRPGDVTEAETSAMRMENGGNFIIDHCSLSWGIEETTHFSSANDFTVQWCIVSEGLYSSVHKKGDRGYAAQWGGQYSTYHHNLLAHNQSRSPRINGANKNDIYALVDYRNNMNFNQGSSGACYGGEWEVGGGRGFAHTNFVNNYSKGGPATPASYYFAAPSYARANITPDGYGLWYFSKNIMEGNAEKTEDNWKGVNTGSVGGKNNIYSAEEFVRNDGISTGGEIEDYDSYTETANEAYGSILENVGAIYPKRDGHDARIIAEIKGEVEIKRSVYVLGDVTTPKRGITSGIIDTPWNLKPEGADDNWSPWYSYYQTVDASMAPIDSDHDGMPDAWEIANNLNPNDASDRNKKTISGYTALEVYLNGLVGEQIELDFGTSIFEEKVEDHVKYSISDNVLRVYSDSGISSVKVFDTLGLMRVSQTADFDVINVSGLSAGVYILEVTHDNNRRYVAKINKSK